MLLEISIYRIILGLISVIFLWNGISKFIHKENYQSVFKVLSTIIIWGSIFTLSFFPMISRTISHTLGLGENLNTLIFIGFVITFMAIFKLINITEKLERNISEIVRKDALEKIKK
jgi:hypothetical protein